MKRTIIILSLFIAGIINIKAQNLYYGFGGGYGFAVAKGDYQNTVTTSYASGTESIEYTNKTYSYGKGVNLSVFLGYMFTKHIGAELNIDYLYGSKYQINAVYNPSNQSDEKNRYGKMLRLIPEIKFTEGEKRFRPYVKAGLIIGVLPIIIENEESKYTTGPGPLSLNTDLTQTRKYTGGISPGFHGAIGTDIVLDNRTVLFAEVSGYFQSYSPKKCKLTAYTQGGQNGLGGMSLGEIETDYSSTYTPPNSSARPDYSQPSKGLKFTTPFSSVGFIIGLRINIIKKAKEKKE